MVHAVGNTAHDAELLTQSGKTLTSSTARRAAIHKGLGKDFARQEWEQQTSRKTQNALDWWNQTIKARVYYHFTSRLARRNKFCSGACMVTLDGGCLS